MVDFKQRYNTDFNTSPAISVTPKKDSMAYNELKNEYLKLKDQLDQLELDKKKKEVKQWLRS